MARAHGLAHGKTSYLGKLVEKTRLSVARCVYHWMIVSCDVVCDASIERNGQEQRWMLGNQRMGRKDSAEGQGLFHWVG